MKKILHPSLTLGARRPFLRKTEGNLARIDMILHTNIGDLPRNPDFGCDLTSLVGEAASKFDHLERATKILLHPADAPPVLSAGSESFTGSSASPMLPDVLAGAREARSEAR